MQAIYKVLWYLPETNIKMSTVIEKQKKFKRLSGVSVICRVK